MGIANCTILASGVPPMVDSAQVGAFASQLARRRDSIGVSLQVLPTNRVAMQHRSVQFVEPRVAMSLRHTPDLRSQSSSAQILRPWQRMAVATGQILGATRANPTPWVSFARRILMARIPRAAFGR